jgi:AcrR family transcriptional regulator
MENIAPNPVRDQILSAAEMLFAEYGRDAITVEKIGQRARVSPGVLFYYFSTKDELFTAVIEERSPLAGLKTELPETLRDARPGMAPHTLRVLGVQFVRALRMRNHVLRILLREFSIDERVARHFQQLWTYASELIARYLREELAPTNVPVDVAARMFVSHLMLAAATDGACDPEFLVTPAADVVLNGPVHLTQKAHSCA